MEARAIRAFNERMSSVPPVVAAGLAVAGVAVVGVIDFETGFELSLSVLYVGPVAFATWYCGVRIGAGVSVLSSLAWVIADVSAGHPYSHGAIPYWNALVRLAFFLITVVLIGEVRVLLAAERRLARTDSLTGVLNARAFLEQLDRELALADRFGRSLTLAYVDLDDFKQVNDVHGHAEGDRLLRLIGSVLQASMRRTDLVARLGGDEFAVLLPGTDQVGGEEAMVKTRQQLSRALAGRQPAVTCSVGVVTFPRGGVSAEEAIRVADQLMYEVKRRGKNGVAMEVADRR